MTKILVGLLSLMLAALLCQSAVARGLKVQAVEVELVADRAGIRPGEPFKLGLRLRHDPHWHSYWRNPGDSGLPTQFNLVLPAGLSAGPIEWPAPQLQRVGPLANYGYEGEIILPVTVTSPPDLAGDRARFQARAEWLMCKEVCVPGEAELALDMPIDRQSPLQRSDFSGVFEVMAARTPKAMPAVDATLSGSVLSIRLPRDVAPLTAGAGVPDVRFFPYATGLIDNPAPQALFDLGEGHEGGLRLAVPIADKVNRGTFDKAGFFGGDAAGVILIDGQAFEVQPHAVGALASGRPLSMATADASALGARTAALSSSSSSALAAAATNTPGATSATSGAAVSTGRAAAASGWTELLATLLAVALAFVGGVLLNLMPCVFPVVGLKVLGFANDSSVKLAADRAKMARHHAFAFTAGVLLSFWFLAGVLALLQAAGRAVGWGFQLQSPGFVAAMALLFVAIGLNLSGVYQIGASMTRLGAVGQNKHGPVGSLLSGVLAVLVATPCSAPFMGSALGFTLGHPFSRAWPVFTALGLGMSLPYLVLGFHPQWLRWLPKPGRWMESLRQFLAFPMYGTAAWLGWVLAQQAGLNALFGLSIGAITLGLAAWILGRFVQQGTRRGSKRRIRAWHGLRTGLAVACALLALWLAWPSGSEDFLDASARRDRQAPVEAPQRLSDSGWQDWSEAALSAGLASGRPVFVEFTAAWCVSCQVNKKLVLESDQVINDMNRLKVLRLRADWTRLDSSIGLELAKHGRNGVPLYLMFKPGQEQPEILPEVLTTSVVLAALGS